MTRTEQSTGKHGQELAAAALRAVGVELVEQIGTPVRLIPHPKQAGYYRVIYGDKVSGDHRGILPGGRSVLAETKTILDRPLRWSDFREHQPGALSAHVEQGGISLVVWVNQFGVQILQWPIDGFGPGKSIDFERASALAVEAIR